MLAKAEAPAASASACVFADRREPRASACRSSTPACIRSRPRARPTGRRVLGWALDRADLDWPFVDHDAPAPLAALWARNDLGAAMMCGLPFAQRQPAADPDRRAAAVARALRRPSRSTSPTSSSPPIRRTARSRTPSAASSATRSPIRCRAASRCATTCCRYRTAQRTRLYRASVGGLINARGVIDALAAGRIDVGPLDSYSHDLLQSQRPGVRGAGAHRRQHGAAADPAVRRDRASRPTRWRDCAPRCSATARDARSSPNRWRACSSPASPFPDPADYDVPRGRRASDTALPSKDL